MAGRNIYNTHAIAQEAKKRREACPEHNYIRERLDGRAMSNYICTKCESRVSWDHYKGYLQGFQHGLNK